MNALQLIGITCVTVCLSAPVLAQYAAPVTQVSGARADGVRIATVLLVAEIVDIDLETREVTLRDDVGQDITIVAPEAVTRLEDHSVGDMLVVEYLSSIAGEMRQPTEAELANPWMELSGDAMSTDVSHPAVGSVRQFRSVATIKELNRQARTAVIEDARGRSHTITHVQPEKYDGVAVGDQGIVVFTEAVAVSVERHAAASR
ncbi:MAG: hypothetical protein AAGF46_12445 [Pseudomonadota bacterium]